MDDRLLLPSNNRSFTFSIGRRRSLSIHQEVGRSRPHARESEGLWDARVFGDTEGHEHVARGVRWLAGRPQGVAAAALAALLRSLVFEKVTVVFEQPPAT